MRHVGMTLHAHFLKSVSLEIGQVASSVSLLTSCNSSKNGMNIEALWHLVAAARFNAGHDLATSRYNLDHLATMKLALLRIVRVHEQNGVGDGTVQLRHAPCHRAGMPVLEHTAGGQPQIVVLVRAFGCRLVRAEDDRGTAIRLAVEPDVFAGLDVRVVALAKAPQRFLFTDNRPAQAARLW